MQKIVTHNVVHMRADPQSDSEQVSQTLMGRLVTVLPAPDGVTSENWSYIESDDTYRGWVENRWLGDKTHALILSPVGNIFADLREMPLANAPLIARLPITALVAVGDRNDAPAWVPTTLPDGTQGWLSADAFADPPATVEPDALGAELVRRAREFMGTPYLWGGSSSFGLDCSGFVQLCYRLCGVILLRDADLQRDDPRFAPVDKSDLREGDLVFFGKPDKITHVGMHIGANRFIHAAGGAGVILTEWGDARYSPGYVDARRMIPADLHTPAKRLETHTR